MLFFAAPLLLSFLPVVALVGLWALWRGKRTALRVASTRLWRNLDDNPATARKRRLVDPVWLLVFLAALLAAAAMPSPTWRTGVDTSTLPAATLQWSLRSLAGQPPELYIHLDQQRNLKPPLTLEWHPAANEDAPYEKISPTDAARQDGLLLRLPIPATQSEISLRLLAGDHLLAAATFLLPRIPPFALLTHTAPGRTIDPALRRVFAINPQARPDDPRIHPAVLLVNDPDFTPNDIPPDTLIVASPDTPLPGITLRDPYLPPAGLAPVTLSLPPFITFTAVQVGNARAADLSADWTPLATLDHHIWLAQRRIAPAGPTLLWLASQPSVQSNWALDRSFVLFFANALTHTFPASSAAHPGDSQIKSWQRTEVPVPPPPITRETPLAAPLGIAAIVLLVFAVTLLVVRTRH